VRDAKPQDSRRFWPVKVGVVDIEGLRRDVGQLWAEAVAAYRAGEQWWFKAAAEKIARGEQEQRRSSDVWEEAVLQYLVGRAEATVGNILKEAILKPIDRQEQKDMNRVVRILKANRWERVKVRRNGRPGWVYQPVLEPEPPPQSGNTGNKKAAETLDVPSVPTVPSKLDKPLHAHAHAHAHAHGAFTK
jgi:predicted P-loop ATPase